VVPKMAPRARFLNQSSLKKNQPIFRTLRSKFWAFWANHLKSRLKFNNVPVHKTHSVTVRNREKTFKTLAIADPHKCESTQHNKLLGTFTCSNASTGQSARIAYLSWKIEIGRDWYRSQNGRDLGAKVKMCTPVHGLYV